MRIENRFAVVPSATGWQGADAVALAEDFRNDVLVARGTAPAGGQLPPDATGVRVDGADVLVSSIRRVADDDRGAGTEVRLAAMSDAGVDRPRDRRVHRGHHGRPARPAASPRRRSRSGLELALGPWEIRTVVVRRSTPNASRIRPAFGPSKKEL